jgi:pectate lyase
LFPSTTGGSGGATVTVTTLAALTSAVLGDAKKIVVVSGTITGAVVIRPGANTSIVGKKGACMYITSLIMCIADTSFHAALVGVGIRIINTSNVIVRNLKISKVLAETGDAIGVQAASKVWVDHVDLSSDRDHDKDFYDGLLDITHGSTGVTVSNSKFYNHWKSVLIGHSDSNGAEDKKITGKMHHDGKYGGIILSHSALSHPRQQLLDEPQLSSPVIPLRYRPRLQQLYVIHL